MRLGAGSAPYGKIRNGLNIKKLISVLVALLAAGSASAQFYSWGADPASLRWNRLKSDVADVIYADSSEMTARHALFYAEKLYPYIGYGYTHSVLKMPFVLHPENFQSNGLTMFLPKRIEMLTTPEIDNYAMPWMKQLVAHEWRHAVQYNNLNRGVIRVLSYIIGQQSSTVGLLLLPLWCIEGDAVLTETQMSSFGRGLQPKFTLEYRAVGDIAEAGKNTDRWFCGSYRDYIPNHYHIGYQIASYAYTKYDTNIWNDVARYGARNPYVIATTALALKKFYKTSVIKLTRETFSDLASYWAMLPEVDDSSTAVPLAAPQQSYTIYQYPLLTDDATAISLKTDLDRPSRFTATDLRTGEERQIAYTGLVSTRPTFDGNRLWWTEYRRSLLFAERVNSMLCYMSPDDGKPKSVRKRRNILYPTAIDEHHLAFVEYAPDGVYTIVRSCDLKDESRVSLPRFTEIHGLAYDNATCRLYYLATDDDGMHIGTLDDNGQPQQLTEGAYITLSDLSAKNGILYFGSIESGKDEVHCFDIAQRQEYRLTESKFGSFGGSAMNGDSIVLTTYDRRGYHLATQKADRIRIPVEPKRLPHNLVNPPRKKWDVINLDTVRFTAADSVSSFERHRSRRYSKGIHLFNIHSWAPVSYNPFEIVEEGLFRFNLGATVMSQNLLSDSEMFLTYGWNRTEGSFVQGLWRYYGLGANISIGASYGGHQKVYTVARYNPETGKLEIPDTPELGKYYSVSGSVSLPVMFQSGYHTRHLGLSASYNFSNGRVARIDKLSLKDFSNFRVIGYENGLHTLQFGITFQDMVRMSHKDFAPRTGILLNAAYALNPANTHFSDLLALYGRIYLPGFAPHNSISLAAAYQTSIGGLNNDRLISDLSYTSSRLLPRGYTTADIRNNQYFAGSFNYQLPLCYPEGGIPSILYFKRIRLNVGFDYATFQKIYTGDAGGKFHSRRKHIFSYGGDVILDLNFFRMPAAATTTLTLSTYITREGKPYFTAGFGLPF